MKLRSSRPAPTSSTNASATSAITSVRLMSMRPRPRLANLERIAPQPDRLQGQRVSGIVLVSDGQATTTGDSAGRLNAALAYVRQRGIPVFAVGVGDDEPPKNVMVLRLQAPAEARQGATVEMTAYLSHRNCEGKNVQVRLLRRALKSETWDDAEASEEVTLSQKGEVQEVKLQTRAEALGEYVYKAVAQALQDEFTEEDNFATAKVKVSEEKVKILLVSGDAGWEFQYLRNLLLRSPDRYAVSVWQQNADSKFNQQASSGMKLTQLPRTAAELYKYEVVILYDPAYTEGGFDKQFVDMLEGFVDKHHGGLCYIASNKYSDSNLVTSAEEFPFVGLANVLPVVLGHRTIHIAERIGREPTAYPVVPTPVGLDHPALRFGSDAGETLSIWRSLPGAYWSHPVIRMKPLASSLAVSTDPLNRLADDPSQPAPLIAVQYYGKGRSLFIGFDETWRWRYLTDGYYYRLFWHNVMDFLAAGRLQSKRIIITTGADRFAVGENLRIHVEAYGRNYEPLEEETFEVEMINAATKAVQKIVLQRDPKKKLAGHYEATLPLKTQGSFELTAKREDPSYKDEVAGKTITVALPEEEFRHPEADLAMLETIAPEGRFLRIHESGGLAGLVPSGKMSVFHDVPHELWDVPLAIVVIVLLLAAEWILRKKYNMV